MSRRRRRPPLPVRDGIGPTAVRLPPGDWPTVAAYLTERFPHDRDRLLELFEAGEVVDAEGGSLDRGSAYLPGRLVFYYRDPPEEPLEPVELPVLYRDDDIVVVDKPHFLATTPRGAYVVQTALVQLRRQLDLPELSPAHRLDRLTAGVLVFTARRELRGAYQELFARREVTKAYEAVAPVVPGMRPPLVVRSRIVKRRDCRQAREEPGVPNAETVVESVTALPARPGHPPLGLYRLRPRTGKTHQLRVHLSALGAPIVHDSLYPTPYDVDPHDHGHPLQLLARSIELPDPRSGEVRVFTSRRRLDLAP